MREQPLLPAGEEYDVELQPLGGVQGHDRDARPGVAVLGVGDQRDVLEERFQRRELAHRAHEFLQVFEPALGVRRPLRLPHVDQAALLDDRLGEFFGAVVSSAAPALEIGEQIAQHLPRPRLKFFGLGQAARGCVSDERRGRAGGVQQRQRRLAETPARRVVDALEGEIVVGLRDDPEIGERIANFRALVKARAADHAVGHADLDEPLLELAHLERGAHQDRHLGEETPARCSASISSPISRASSGCRGPRARVGFVAGFGAGEQRLAQPVAVMGDESGRHAEDMPGRAVVALQPDHRGVGEVALEAQDVLDLGAAPAVDRLVVVADAAQIAPLLRDQPQPEILDDVGVLIFVDQDVAETILITAPARPACSRNRRRIPAGDRRNRRR